MGSCLCAAMGHACSTKMPPIMVLPVCKSLIALSCLTRAHLSKISNINPILHLRNPHRQRHHLSCPLRPAPRPPLLERLPRHGALKLWHTWPRQVCATRWSALPAPP